MLQQRGGTDCGSTASTVSLGSAGIQGFTPGEWYTLKVTASDAKGYSGHPRLDVYVNDEHEMTVDPSTNTNWSLESHDTVPHGYAGLFVKSGGSTVDPGDVVATFKNLYISNGKAPGDETAPDPVTGLDGGSLGSPPALHLSWTNPQHTNEDWRWTRVVRLEGEDPPVHWRDGLAVYEGKRSSFTDHDVLPETTYSYAAFTCDHAGNFSAPVTITLDVEAADEAVITVADAVVPVGTAVDFEETGIAGADAWDWDFGDTASGTGQDPSHTYMSAGVYSVAVTATRDGVPYETVAPHAVTVFAFVADADADAEFDGPVQGVDDWYYRQDGDDMTSFTTVGGEDRWVGSDGQVYIAATGQSPSGNFDAERVWVAPEATSLRIDGQVDKATAGGDGVSVRILKDETLLWSVNIAADGLDENQVDGPFGFTLSDVGVAEGDEIRFVVDHVNPNTMGASNPVRDRCDFDITIEVAGGVSAPTADFDVIESTVDPGDEVTFVNLSLANPAESTYAWDFGDSSGTSTEFAPTYEYLSPGHYDVTLTVSGPWGEDEELKQGVVIVRDTVSSEDELLWPAEDPWYFLSLPYDDDCASGAAALTYNAKENRWQDSPHPFVSRTHMHPGQTSDATRKWIAPESGRLGVYVRVRHVNPNSDGGRFRMLHGESEFHPPIFIPAGDTTERIIETEVDVMAGDALYFRLDRGPGDEREAGTKTADLTEVTIEIDYVPVDS